jgi:ELWxxDGT repeat protein
MKIVIVTGLLVGGILGVFYLAGLTAVAAGPPEPTLVMDINPNAGSNPTWLTVVGNMLYFVANDGSSGFELWMSDGIDTTMVKDINLRALNLTYPITLIAFDGRLFFSANDDVTPDRSCGSVMAPKRVLTDVQELSIRQETQPRNTSRFLTENSSFRPMTDRWV